MNVENSSSCPGFGSFVIMLNFPFHLYTTQTMTAALALFCQADFGKLKRFSFCTFQSLFFSGSCCCCCCQRTERKKRVHCQISRWKKKIKLAAGPFFCFPTPLFDIKNSQKPSESGERERVPTQ